MSRQERRSAFARSFLTVVFAPFISSAQISISAISPTATQAILTYISPVSQSCSLKVADMNRPLTLTSAIQAGGQVTVSTAAPHGLFVGAVVYLANSAVTGWNGWQTITSVPTTTTFTFASTIAGSSTAGTLGVMADDVNPALFSGADQDSRPGNPSVGNSRSFVIGHRYAETALDGNRYSRALQVNSNHHYTLTCGTQSFDGGFQTQNLPLGDTHNEGPPADRAHPGQYAYPTVQWANQHQTLIDPITGVRSVRSTGPTGDSSGPQAFVSAVNSSGAWQNPTGPTQGGTASVTGQSCGTGNCALLLRADNLSVYGGPSYTTLGNSLDWVSVTIAGASINNGGCSGDDCKVVACLTVNGVSCSSGTKEISLTTTPNAYTLGSQALMDLWQGAGAPGMARPDVSQATGTVNYSAATKQVTVAGGNLFSLKWTAGSQITIAGAQYTIASIQNEALLTLVTGPASDLNGASYSANNFGVLIWKKTSRADTVSIGATTYQYGSSYMPVWSSSATAGCSAAVSGNGVPGYNCFSGQELFWYAADGSDIHDLGFVGLWYGNGNGSWGQGWACGTDTNGYQFDPQNGDVWYCSVELNYNPNTIGIVQAHYMGSHAAYTPGTQIPDCVLSNGAQPCIQFTIMVPNINQAALAFSPAFQAGGYQVGYWIFGGVSQDGDLTMMTREPSGQDSKGWLFVFTLGDRTPAGTDANSVRLVGGASSYQRAPFSWCTIHFAGEPENGWQSCTSNDLTKKGAAGTYTMTLTSPPLNATPGATSGLNTCPSNVLGVTGQVCTAITVSGEPLLQLDGSFLQATQVGDLILIDSEYMRIVVKNSSTSLVVQRGYVSAAAAHGGTTLTMACGTRNGMGAAEAMWNYRSDPYGTNASLSTIVTDPTMGNGHAFSTPSLMINMGGNSYLLGQTLCPSYLVICYEVRLGGSSTSPIVGVAENPYFDGTMGIGLPNQVDGHPGPCVGAWCLDGRPMDGGSWGLVGSAASPFVNIGGQLWKYPGAQSLLNRKILTTMAYVGRWPLVDSSGPGALLGSGPQDSYKYCLAQTAGECYAGSAAGDLYVNAPYVRYPYCNYPGIAVQADDTTSICIGDLGANTGNTVQVGVTGEDTAGALTRRLGPNYAKWNQQDVFWNMGATPNGGLSFSQVRWFDGVRSDDLVNILPPYPASDGITRNSFLAVTLASGTPPTGTSTAVVEFGYAENGVAGNFFCTSRQETCVAVNGNVNATTPFYFETSESYAGMPCGGGCSIVVPALAQHVLYCRWKFKNSSGQVTGTGNTYAVATEAASLAASVVVSVSPSAASLNAGQTQQFTASVTGSSNPVIWSVSGAGSISTGGLYSAPATLSVNQTVIVTATVNGVSSSATITLTAPSIAVSPSAATLNAGQTQQFTASVIGSSNPVSWSVSGAGSISTGGLYSAPATVSAKQTVTVTATINGASSSATITLTAPAIAVSPSAATLNPGQTQQFTASVIGSSNPVSWSVSGAGSISTVGLYSAPATVTAKQTAIVTATGNGVSGSATITLTPPAISVSPSAASLSAGQTQQFMATVMGSSGSVAWSVSGGGTISATGLYTAPPTVSATQTVTVTAKVSGVGGSAIVTLNPPITTSSLFTPILVNAGGPAYVDSVGRTWSADTGVLGTGYSAGYVWSVTNAISGTSDPALYQTCHYGQSFTYQFAVPNGNYTVVLKFAEVSRTAPGQRTFNVGINGSRKLTNFDIFAAAGGEFKAIDQLLTVSVTQGQITIQFTAGSDWPMVNAIEIVSAGTVP
jgi:hypothetical protein